MWALSTSQGVVQHRVDQIAQNGTGITVGAMSDSYDTQAGATTRGSRRDHGRSPGHDEPARQHHARRGRR